VVPKVSRLHSPGISNFNKKVVKGLLLVLVLVLLVPLPKSLPQNSD
jgi:hypothetical protein